MKIRDFAIKVLEESETPLTYRQIWENGCKKHYDKALETKSNNVVINISSTIRNDIKNKQDSQFIILSDDPVTLFGLRSKSYAEDEAATRKILTKTVENETKKDEETERKLKNIYNECDLHPALVSYVNGDRHFRCFTKTIVQQEGEQAPKGIDKWTYPDLIGVYFPYGKVGEPGDYDDYTMRVLQTFQISAHKVFSFEVKKTIDKSTLREKYFQAISNSTWANEGYLVAPIIDEGDDVLMQEMALLNSSFGIGVIKLDIDYPAQSRILFPARVRDAIDSNMLNKLIRRSKTNDKVGSVAKLFDYVSRTASSNIAANDPNIFDETWDVETYQEKVRTNGGLRGIVARKK